MDPITQAFIQGAAGAAGGETYVDDVFSNDVWAGDGAAHRVVNGIDIAGEGGMVWTKCRTTTYSHLLADTVRGYNYSVFTDGNGSDGPNDNYFKAFHNDGFTTGDWVGANQSGQNFAGWTFRKAKGFFDVVTWTGNATNSSSPPRQIAHSLGSVPGAIWIKCTTANQSWACYHESLGATRYMHLNDNGTGGTSAAWWNNTEPTSTHFTLGYDGQVNETGHNYVAYIFAGGKSTAATARSISLDGSNDGLKTTSSSDYDFGTGDFTVEFWLKVNSIGNVLQTVDHRTSANNTGHWVNYIDTNGDYKFWMDNDRITGEKIAAGTWNHIATVRNSGTTTLYINGNSQGTWSDTTDYTNTRIIFGLHGPNESSFPVPGKYSNIRIVKGTAVYTESFKPSTKPLENITNTKFLAANNASVTGTTVGTAVAVDSPTASTDSPFDDPAAYKFGEEGDQDIIKCGSYEGNQNTSAPEINLGWEPQYLLIKRTSDSEDWMVFDNIRGLATGEIDRSFRANTAVAEDNSVNWLDLTPTGFRITSTHNHLNGIGDDYLYIAIRRPDGYVGKPVEAATDVFAMDMGASSSTIPNFDSGFPVDFQLALNPGANDPRYVGTRLTQGKLMYLNTDGAESGASDHVYDSNVGWNKYSGWSSSYQSWMWKRHAGFDVVTYKGTGVVNLAIPHQMSKAPQMMWIKNRDDVVAWRVFHIGHGGGTNPDNYGGELNNSIVPHASDMWFQGNPTSTHIKLKTSSLVNGSGKNYVAMLFASIEGISKVGYFNGSSSDVNNTTGFSPRFIIIKRSDNAGSWWCFDTVRGLNSTSAADPRMPLDSTGSSAGGVDYIATSSTGFTVRSNDADINANGGQYIYYAHA